MEAAASGKCPVATTLQMAGSVSGRGCSVEPWQPVAIVTDALVNHASIHIHNSAEAAAAAFPRCTAALL